jgi:excisionase family DNA binding protein
VRHFRDSQTQPQKLAYTFRKVASPLSLSRSHIYELIHAGAMDPIKVGRSRRITAKQLAAYLSEREAEVQ